VALAASCLSGCGGGPTAGPAATPPRAPTSSVSGACAPHACISLSRLAHSIDSQLKGHVVGYVALVGQSKVVASGLARTAADPPKLAMGPDVMVNVISTVTQSPSALTRRRALPPARLTSYFRTSQKLSQGGRRKDDRY
jgi:hypothetical protein